MFFILYLPVHVCVGQGYDTVVSGSYLDHNSEMCDGDWGTELFLRFYLSYVLIY